jgi:dienelactone hydrolase
LFEYFPGNYRWSYNTLLALSAGGQIGDIELIGARLRDKVGNDSIWHEEWSRLADILERRAVGRASETASDTLYLASLYRLIGEHFIPPSDPLRLDVYRRVLEVFENARSIARWPVERVAVPYEDTMLPAYFMPCVSQAGRRPAVIFLCGLDTTKELSFLRVRQQLAVRGMHCLAIDTPGIGEPLRFGKLPTQFDYEKPVAAALDYLNSRNDVDSSKIGIIGSSLGGYYVARAAAFDSRLRAAVAWGVVFDYHAVWVRRLTSGGTVAAPAFQLMFVTGTQTMEAALECIKDFKVAPLGPLIDCPFLIVHGAEDQQVTSSDATAMYDAIGSSDKELKVFTGEDGGTAHCQFDNHLPALQYIADWIGNKLAADGT